MPRLVQRLRREGFDVAQMPMPWDARTMGQSFSPRMQAYTALLSESRQQEHRIWCTADDNYHYMRLLDVRHVIYSRLPLSIPAFLRANQVVGLDGDPGTITVLVSQEELATSKNFEPVRLPSFLAIRRLIASILKAPRVQLPSRFGDEHLLVVDLDHLSNQLQILTRQIWRVLDLLRELEYIDWSNAITRKYILLQASRSILVNEDLPASRSGLGAYLLSLQRRGRVELDVMTAAETLGVGPDLVVEELDSMIRERYVKHEQSIFFTLFHIVEPHPTDEMIESLAHLFFGHMLKVMKMSTTNTSLVHLSLTRAPCIHAALAVVVGTELPDGKTACGRCSAASAPFPLALTFSCTIFPSFPQRYDGVCIRRRLLGRICKMADTSEQCVGGAIGSHAAKPRRVDQHLVQRIVQGWPEFAHDPRILVRIALGVLPIRRTWTKDARYIKDARLVRALARWASKPKLFGSMYFCDFEVRHSISRQSSQRL